MIDAHLAARRPDAVAADRHGNRLVGGAEVARQPRSACRSPASACPSSAASGLGECLAGQACCRDPERRLITVVVSRHRAVDLLGEDRRDGRARDGLHAPHRRPGDRHLGDHRRHHRLDHHGGDVRSRASPAADRRPSLTRSVAGHRAVPGRSFTVGRRTRVLSDPLGQRQFRSASCRLSRPSWS